MREQAFGVLGSTEGRPGHSLSCPARPPATLRSSLPAPGQEGSGDLQTSLLMTVSEQPGLEVPALRRRVDQRYSLITRLAGRRQWGQLVGTLTWTRTKV